MIDAPAPLTSWTRTLNEDDACTLLDNAEPGTALADWEELGHRILPQAGLKRRQELVRIVRSDLLDHADGVVSDSAFLRLFRDGSPHRRRTLFQGRLLRHRPLVSAALDELVHPAVAEADRPLAREDAATIPGPAWDAFLLRLLRPGIPDEALKKTRSTLQGALRDAGCLEIVGSAAGRTTLVRHGRPDPVGFAWVLAHELVESGQSEASASWGLHRSFAARLFATEPGYAATCIEAGVQAELLRRDHLMAEPLLRPGAL